MSKLLEGFHRIWSYLCRNCILQTSKAPLESQAKGTSLFTSAASNQRGYPEDSPSMGTGIDLSKILGGSKDDKCMGVS